ncbi:MAG TPA: hypothetical protein VM580_10725 [Labilithrix sp.]|jgi:hypothetical protein|nr:hypothetical protein [Labilithrix sp.]
MAQRTERTGWKHPAGVYRRFTLVHFTYALVLTIPAALMLLALDLEVAMVGLLVAEMLAFFFLPHFACVREAVDARIDARAHAEAASARAVLLMRMSEEHRRELNALEKIAAALRERTAASPQAEDFLGIERLIELYVRLAIAHRASRNSLEVVGRTRLDEEIAALESCLVSDRGRDAAIEKRLGILQMRREARRAAIDEQAAIDNELAMIGHTLRWMEEHCAATGTEGLRAELEFALSSRERDAATLRELSALRDSDFDASVIRLGRDPSPARRDQPLVRIAVPGGQPENEETLGLVAAEPDAILVRI